MARATIDRVEEVGGRPARPAADDRADGRVHRVGVVVEESGDRRVAFGDPRAFVERLRDLDQRREVERALLAAVVDEPVERLHEGRLGQRVAEELEMRRGGNAEAEVGWHRPAIERQAARMRVLVVGPDRGDEDIDGIGHRRREDRDAIDVPTRGDDAARADQAARGLQPDDVVEARGHAARAGGVGAERGLHEAVRHGHRRARTRSTADIAGVEAVGHGAVRGARAHESAGELVEVGLADDVHARGFQLLDDGGRTGRRIGERRARRGGREAGDIDVVLDGEAPAHERAAGADRT